MDNNRRYSYNTHKKVLLFFSEYSKKQKTISAMYLYPIKSCGGLKITTGSWPLSSTSLKYDRQFVIMQGRSTLTQKSEPLLCQIKPNIDLKTKIMTLSVPWSDETCVISLDLTSKEVQEKQLCSGKVCGDFINGLDCGDEVADWLEIVLGLTGKTLLDFIIYNDVVYNFVKNYANNFFCEENLH